MPNLLHRSRNRLLPGRCRACLCRLTGGGLDLCDGCFGRLPWNHQPCPRCGEPATRPRPSGPTCGACRASPPAFAAALAPLLHRDEVRRWVRALKYHRDYHAARLLGGLLACAVRQSPEQQASVQGLVPVPSTRIRLLRRGHNPAALIARELGRQLGLTVHWHLARRRGIRQQSQIGLSRLARAHNLQHAFQCRVPCEGLALAIVDDVITTGATAEALARELLSGGASRVEVWAPARTPAGW